MTFTDDIQGQKAPSTKRCIKTSKNQYILHGSFPAIRKH